MNQQETTINGCRLSFTRGGTGSPVLLLHGAGGSAAFRPIAEDLSARHDVILPDHPAFGESDGPDWMINVSDLAYFYLDLMQELGLRDVHVVGHSMGGWLACEIAIRSTARIKSLALVAPAGLYLKGVPYGDIFLWSPEETARNLFVTEEALTAALAYKPTDAELDIMARNRVAAARYLWSPRLHNPDLGKWLHRIDVPTLLLWGAEDRVVPAAYGQEYARLIRGAKLEVYPRCGHIPQTEMRDALVARLNQFIAEVKA